MSAASPSFAAIEETARRAMRSARSFRWRAPRRCCGSIDPDLGELLRRFGSIQVRTCGTVGGNIANGSPIGDLAPVLIALGATLELRRGERVRTLPLENFFLDYGKQDRAAGRVRAPAAACRSSRRRTHFRAYKISKRFDEDISAVLGGVLPEGRRRPDREARVAFGGMAAIPKRAHGGRGGAARRFADERARWRSAADARSARTSRRSPIMRASAAYRAARRAQSARQGAGRDRRRGPRHDAHRRIAGWSPMPPR